MLRRYSLAFALLLLLPAAAFAGEPKPRDKNAPPLPTPTVANFKYGNESDRQVLDFWKANTDKPAPLVVFIHGGAWLFGDKTIHHNDVQKYLDAGCAVASISYRHIQDAMQQKIEPPVKAPLHDAARAIQTLRSKAKEWNIDPTRVGVTGGSAGACSSLWLALHDDLADPNSSDPVARESTRVTCAVPDECQSSLDPKQVREWMPNANYGAHAFGYWDKQYPNEKTFQMALDDREKILPWINEYSPYALASKNDPPIFFTNKLPPPPSGELAKDPTHSAIYAVKLAERLNELGVEAFASYPGHKNEKYASAKEFFIAKLKPTPSRVKNPRAQRAAPKGPAPTVANFKYGTDSERQVLDFWKANTDKPAPLVLMIHGGGWVLGDKSSYGPQVQSYLDKGINVAAINYRLVPQAVKDGIEPAVKAPLHDAARALQTLRSKAKQWNIDPTRIGATGGSAGACTSLWLAFHDDMADPQSSDPVKRESTRLTCAAVAGAQTSLDPKQVREWMPNANYGAHAFSYKGYSTPESFQKAIDDRDKLMPWIKEYSPYELTDKDDPPIFLDYNLPPPADGQLAKDPTHSATYGVKLAERLNELGVDVTLSYPGHKDEKYGSIEKFFVAKLKPETPAESKPRAQRAGPKVPAPTVANFKYGDDSERQVFDFWKANTDKPAPLVLLIHGGGWMGGDKKSYARDVPMYLEAGCAVAAINYRLIQQAMEQKVEPPVKAPLHDAARALQTLRSKAREWNIDPTRVGSTGGSAGACTSLWLAFHDDLADPKSSDPIARESTRLTCAAVNGAQTSLDPKQLREWLPNANYAGHAFGFKADDRPRPAEFQMALDNRDKIMPWIKEYSPIELIDKNDPPVFLQYKAPPPPPGEVRPDPTHSVVYGIKLKEELDKLGVEAVVAWDGNQDTKYGSVAKFLIEKLKAE